MVGISVDYGLLKSPQNVTWCENSRKLSTHFWSRRIPWILLCVNDEEPNNIQVHERFGSTWYHTRTASIHIRVYAESDTLYLWFVHIAQNDLAVKPDHVIYPKYVRTRTNGTWKAHDKVEYLRFVMIDGVMFGGQFYKKTKRS